MGHRHQFNASQSFENEDDQNWNHMHMEQHFVHLGILTLNALHNYLWV